MLKFKELQLYFLLMIAAFPVIARDNSDLTKGNDSVVTTLTRDENILFTMINDIRRQNKLAAIPLSNDLCSVAKTHIADLIKWKPQDKGCSLHSWSGSGKWTSCCNTIELFNIECMKSKPREITGYKGDGYELIYWGEENATPSEAAALWHDVDASADMIVSRNKWSNFQWEAMGVAIKDGYAVLWLGDTTGTTSIDYITENVPVSKQPVAAGNTLSKAMLTETISAKAEPVVKQTATYVSNDIKSGNTNASGTKYYIIVSSFKTAEAADSDLKKFRTHGYSSALIVEGDSNFRIALMSFDTNEKAIVRKNELKETFPGIWIYRK